MIIGTAELKAILWSLSLAAIFAGGAFTGWALRGWQVSVIRRRLELTQAAVYQREQAARRAEAAAMAELARVERDSAALAKKYQVRLQEEAQNVEMWKRLAKSNAAASVPPAVDAAFPLPVGFVRAHDEAVASAGGENCPPENSPAASEPLGAASPVAMSEAIQVILDNYGAYRDCAERLRAWQEYYQALQGDEKPAK